MKNSICILLFFIYINSFSQRDRAFVSDQVFQFTAELESRGISNYYYTERYCEGENLIFLMRDESYCVTNGDYVAAFIIWMEIDKLMIKKMDNCGMFVSLEVNDSGIYSFFEDNVQIIQNRPVKPYEIVQKEGGPVLSTDIYGCHIKYGFSFDGVSFVQEYRAFDLTNVALEENINYEYNTGLEIVELDKLMDKVIKEIEDSKWLKRL